VVLLPFEDNGGRAYCTDLSQNANNARLELRPGTYYFHHAPST
jgi:hypothetical protein